MAEKDDGLGLSLSLKCPETYQPPPPPAPAPAVVPPAARFPLNLLPSPPLSFLQRHQKLPFMTNHTQDLNAETRPFARVIDVNRPPAASAAIVVDDDAFVSSPNSTVSSVSGKRVEREENEAERESSSHGISGEDEDDGGDAAAARKKLRLSKDQAAVLEETFKEHNTLNPKQKLALAKQLDLRPRQVEVWFQNRRARTKLKQTEVDCEYLKRCCDTLTEENRRLQKEVNELRALKLSPQFYMNMSPPTTLTMCPQCERVAVSSSSSSSSAAAATSSAIGSTGLPKALLGAGHQKHNNPFLPRASVIPHRPHDGHHPRW
ncbi:homeobox-leucine zipper protein HAT4-like [Rutidosis leptorrhynchoides]|uniref:homeobox-leucine zipper protein HAT4-like n=1 Tax=Rutidosis leptorrhynchoides TaxID=125765 RepID=UPI003A9A20A4